MFGGLGRLLCLLGFHKYGMWHRPSGGHYNDIGTWVPSSKLEFRYCKRHFCIHIESRDYDPKRKQ